MNIIKNRKKFKRHFSAFTFRKAARKITEKNGYAPIRKRFGPQRGVIVRGS